VENSSTLKSIVGSSPELNEHVLREHVESVDEKRWTKELVEIYLLSRDRDRDKSQDRDKNSDDKFFDEFIIMACLACVSVDREDHVKPCLKFWPKYEDLLNHELVSQFNQVHSYFLTSLIG